MTPWGLWNELMDVWRDSTKSRRGPSGVFAEDGGRGLAQVGDAGDGQAEALGQVGDRALGHDGALEAGLGGLLEPGLQVRDAADLDEQAHLADEDAVREHGLVLVVVC